MLYRQQHIVCPALTLVQTRDLPEFTFTIILTSPHRKVFYDFCTSWLTGDKNKICMFLPALIYTRLVINKPQKC